MVLSISDVTSELACLESATALCLLLPPAAAARSQARPGISLSTLCIWSQVCIKYYLCGAQLCDKTYLRMDGGRVRERRESVLSRGSKNLYRDRWDLARGSGKTGRAQ